jgi:DNA-binding NarL/FixJ family response regulator
VLVLTTFDLDEYVYAALRAGASGFLLKDVERDRLIEAVHTVAAGQQLVGASVLRRGRTNAEIAGELVVSHATVKTHVASILRKCDLRDRVQGVVLAHESGLVVPGE